MNIRVSGLCSEGGEEAEAEDLILLDGLLRAPLLLKALLPKPRGSVIRPVDGEWANFTRLALGCMEAHFCNSTPIGDLHNTIGIWFEKKKHEG